MFAAELLLLLFLGAALAPNSVLGRWLIREPSRALSELTPLKAAIAVISTALLLGMIASAPEMVALFGMADLSLLMDIAALSMLMGAGARWSAVKAVIARLPRLVARLARPTLRSRALRTRPRRLRPPRADDTDGAGWAFA